jgi:hypothetical protein
VYGLQSSALYAMRRSGRRTFGPSGRYTVVYHSDLSTESQAATAEQPGDVHEETTAHYEAQTSESNYPTDIAHQAPGQAPNMSSQPSAYPEQNHQHE